MPASASPPPSPPVRTPGQQPSHPASATNRSRTPQNDRFALYSPRNPDRRWIRINGAGGGVGTFAVQIARSFGADVTGVDSAGKLDMVRSIGADHVIDYTQEDFTLSGERYDLIFDIAVNHSLSDCKRALTPKGTYAFIGHDHYGRLGRRWFGSLGRVFKLLLLSPFVSQLPGLRSSMETEDRLAVLKELVEAGKITPVIDRTYQLSEVAEAIRYLEEGHARGKVVITV